MVPQLLLLLLVGACALYYEAGFDHHYTYSSESDILGLHNVTTIVKFRIRPVNSTSDNGSLNMLIVDSFVQHSEKGYCKFNSLSLFSLSLSTTASLLFTFSCMFLLSAQTVTKTSAACMC